MLFNRRLVAPALTALFIAASGDAQPARAPAPVPADAEIRRILADRVDVHRQSVGIVVGVIEPSGRRLVTHGRRSKDDATPIDGETVFEIGSITKVFTSLLLADAVQRGEVALADPVAKYLPATVKVPTRNGKSITLHDLATHTSGLPRLPSNMLMKDPLNPYADYSVDQLYQFLSTYELPRDIGMQFEYSNLGAGLLGHALARRAGMDYESVVRTRITGPLGMTKTGVSLTPDMKAQLAPGHSPALDPVPLWDLPALAGAGALRSTANDMLTFLEAALGYRASPFGPAFAAMTATRRPAAPQMGVGLGWLIVSGATPEVVWHNGGTGGYRTWIGYQPQSRTGVVILTNAGTAAGPDDIGRHLFDAQVPLLAAFPQATQPKPRAEAPIDPALFDRYVGRYQLAPAAVMTMTRDGEHFFVQLTGQQRFEIFPESETAFFLKVVDAQLAFETDPRGKAIAVVLHQNGAQQRAVRIEGEPVIPIAITLDPSLLDRYIGNYQVAPAMTLSVTRKGNSLFAQPTGQPAQEIFPSSEREFFLKVIDARLTFEIDAGGKATALILQPQGMRAPRVD